VPSLFVREAYADVLPMVAGQNGCFGQIALTNLFVRPRQTSILAQWTFFAIRVSRTTSKVTTCIGQTDSGLKCGELQRANVALWSNVMNYGAIVIGNDPTKAYDCRLKGSFRDVRLYIEAPQGTDIVTQAFSVPIFACAPLCKACTGSSCTECIAGYFLDGDNCLECSSNCLKCNSTGCLKCSANYFLLDQACGVSCPSGYSQNYTLRQCVWVSNVYIQYKFTQGDVLTDSSKSKFHATLVRKPLTPATQRGGFFNESPAMINPSSLAAGNSMTVEIWLSPRGSMQTALLFGIVRGSYANVGIGLKLVDNSVSFIFEDMPQLTVKLFNVQSSYPKQWYFVYFSTGVTGTKLLTKLSSYPTPASTVLFDNNYAMYEAITDSFMIGGYKDKEFYTGFMYDFKLYTSTNASSSKRASTTCSVCSLCPRSLTTCIPTCDVTEFIIATGCSLCDGGCPYDEPPACSEPNCLECEEDLCTACNPSFELVDVSCSCPTGTALVGAACETCSANCDECSSTTCIRCASSKYYVDADGLCSPCMQFCEACSAATDCSACSQGYSFIGLACVPPPSAPPEETPKPKEPEAVTLCGSGCLVCENGRCLECPSNYSPSDDACSCKTEYLSVSQECMKCPKGQYFVSESCSPCRSVCAECVSSAICTVCKADLTLTNGDCVSPACSGAACNPCNEACSVCDPTGCLECTSGADAILGVCQCREGLIKESGLCTRLLLLELFASEGVLKVTFPAPPMTLQVDSSMFVVNDDSKVLRVAVQRMEGNQMYIALNSDKITTVYFTLLATLLDSGGLAYSHKVFSIAAVSLPSTAVAETESMQISSQTTTGAVMAGTAFVSLFSGTFSSLVFTVNFLSVMSYIPLININLPPTAEVFLKSSNQSSTLVKALIDLLPLEEIPKPFDRAENYGFVTSLVLLNILGNLSMIVVLVLVYLSLRLLSKIKTFKKYAEKAAALMWSKAGWNYFLTTYVEFLIASAIQLRGLSLQTTLTAMSSMCGVAIFGVLCGVPVFILGLARYYHDEIVSGHPIITQSRWNVLFASFKPNEASFIYYSIFIAQRTIIISVLVLVDNPLIQLILITSIVSVVRYTQKALYVMIVRPQVKKVEFILVAIFDLSELAIVLMTGSTVWLDNDFSLKVLDIGCGVVIFGAQFASLGAACFTLAIKIKAAREAKRKALELKMSKVEEEKSEVNTALEV
jgi:hypothetical protein